MEKEGEIKGRLQRIIYNSIKNSMFKDILTIADKLTFIFYCHYLETGLIFVLFFPVRLKLECVPKFR